MVRFKNTRESTTKISITTIQHPFVLLLIGKSKNSKRSFLSSSVFVYTSVCKCVPWVDSSQIAIALSSLSFKSTTSWRPIRPNSTRSWSRFYRPITRCEPRPRWVERRPNGDRIRGHQIRLGAFRTYREKTECKNVVLRDDDNVLCQNVCVCL